MQEAYIQRRARCIKRWPQGDDDVESFCTKTSQETTTCKRQKVIFAFLKKDLTIVFNGKSMTFWRRHGAFAL
jgi:hypothetical protein